MAGEAKRQADEAIGPPAPLADVSLPFGMAYLLRRLHRVFSRRLEAEAGRLGGTAQQWFFLRELYERDGQTQSELARALSIERATATTALAGMERQGLVRRRTEARDRRKTLVFLTPRARALQPELFACAERVNAEALRGFAPGEVDALRQGALRMMTNLITIETTGEQQ